MITQPPKLYILSKFLKPYILTIIISRGKRRADKKGVDTQTPPKLNKCGEEFHEILV